MNRTFDLSDEDSCAKVLEDLTKNAKQTQDNMLEEILTLNMNTEYLRRFLHGRSDKQLFKKNVPVVTYDDFKPYIDRVANGEPSNVISYRPIDFFLRSSGTSQGVQKLMPWNNEDLGDFKFVFDVCKHVISKNVDGVEQGKGMMFFFNRSESFTPGGLPSKVGSSCFFTSNSFKNRSSNWYYSYTSPDEVILCLDNKQNLYCHLLCGLVQRDEVVRVGTFFASVLVRAIKFLEESWKELCSNIRSGHVSDWITDVGCRNSISLILKGPHPELADMIELECSQNSWEGIIPRLWPKCKYIESILTGSMAQYVPTLEFYCKGLPLISILYACSETMLGVNLDPLCKPQDVSYTLMPNLSYFEFLPVDGNKDEIVDLVHVKLGCYYELVVTNSSGLYRMRVGDIVLVTGFLNEAPQFRFVRRENVVLSVDMEKTSEEDLFNAISQAKLVLQPSNIMLMDFTSYVDISTIPGHYVLYWELKAQNKDGIPKIDPGVLVECCFVVEVSLNVFYKTLRNRSGVIGPLEIRVVQQGTFDSLMDFFVSQGAAMSQYKTPRCINSAKAIDVLEKGVVGRFFSEKCPT